MAHFTSNPLTISCVSSIETHLKGEGYTSPSCGQARCIPAGTPSIQLARQPWLSPSPAAHERCQRAACTAVVQSLSHVRLSVTQGTAARRACLSFTIFWSLLKLMSIESVTLSNHLILCCPLLLLLSIFPSIRVFSSESVLCIRYSKYWSFSFSPSNEYSGLISISVDWFDLLAVRGTIKSLLQHHSSKASVLQCSVFFMVQLSYPYMITGKTIVLTTRSFVDKVMSLLCNRFVIAFLPRSKHLLIS